MKSVGGVKIKSVKFGQTVILSLAVAACSNDQGVNYSQLAAQPSIAVNVTIANNTEKSNLANLQGVRNPVRVIESHEVIRFRELPAAAVGYYVIPFAVLAVAPIALVGYALQGPEARKKEEKEAQEREAAYNQKLEQVKRDDLVISKSFDPSSSATELEALIAGALRQRAAVQNGPCIFSRSERNPCKASSSSPTMNLHFKFNLARSDGVLSADVVTVAKVTSEPGGLMGPNCVAFISGQEVGEKIVLAKDNGAPLKAAFRKILPGIANGVAAQIFPAGGAKESRKQAKARRKHWLQTSCEWDYATLR